MADKVYSVDIDAPIQKVWDEITGVGRVQRHMFDCILDNNQPGRKYLWHDRPRKHVIVRGEIVESIAPSAGAAGRFVQTFKFTMLPDDYSLVTWEIIPIGPSRTKVTVTHSKLDPSGQTWKKIDGGWPTILQNLKRMMETGSLSFGCRLMFATMRYTSFMLPKATHISNHQD